MIKELRYKTIHGKQVYVPFYDRVTVIGGDSSSGKSFIKDTVQEYYNINGKANVIVYDYKAPVELSSLKSHKNKLIIIDNADLLLDRNDPVCKYINNDSQNQYLLFMRSHNGIDVSINNYAELEFKDSQLIAIYKFR